MIVSFEVLGNPVGKGRPRFSIRNGRVNTRTPDATVLYENYVRLMYQEQCGHRFPDDAALAMDVTAFYQIPKSASQKKKNDMQFEKIRPTKTPDCDNVLKAIADSLQGVAYRDDKNIVECRVRKFYSDIPRVIVGIKDIDTGENNDF